MSSACESKSQASRRNPRALSPTISAGFAAGKATGKHFTIQEKRLSRAQKGAVMMS